MRSCTRIALAASAAALVLAAAVGGASARRLQFSNQSFRAVWSFLGFESVPAGAFRVECPVTLEGSFHSRTISKVSGQLVGYVTRSLIGALASCRNNTNVQAISLQTTSLPWHVRYSHFVGTLPSIEAITVQFIGMGILFTTMATHCLYKSTQEVPARFQFRLEESGQIRDFIPEFASQIPRFEGVMCPGTIIIGEREEVTAAVTVLGTTTRISVTLVQ